MDEISEQEMIEAILFAHEAIKDQCKAINELAGMVEGISEKREYSHEEEGDETLYNAIHQDCYNELYEIAKSPSGKNERSEKFAEVLERYKAPLTEEELEEKGSLINTYFGKVKKEAVRNMALKDGQRLDGRATTEIRDIWSEVAYLPGTHGSAVFTRGETQSLTTVTLGTKLDEQTLDGAFISGSLKFLLHYNFPPFSTGEARPMRGTSRREIGHGNLAMRALKRMIPADFPYTVRVVSDILESNGSSSMATVCAGSMAMMDAGIPVHKQVSGIAMGLIMGEDGNFAVLSDILGDEDFLGDMDFKVAGTKDGITACQMDIKVQGLSEEILRKALEQSHDGRMHILNKMNETISVPEEDFKPNAPRIHSMLIPKDLIGAVIGPGGKIIQEIQKETNTTIVIEEIENHGKVDVAATSKEEMDLAVARIKAITAQPEVGEEYDGKVKAIAPYGAFVEIIPGKDGLLHISEIDWKRIENVADILKEGDQVKVKLIDIDKKTGKMKLSRKVLLPKPEKKEG
jgi:polyribonucleotide nucleotidyltransferase